MVIEFTSDFVLNYFLSIQVYATSIIVPFFVALGLISI
jgi:hypothetical protein